MKHFYLLSWGVAKICLGPTPPALTATHPLFDHIGTDHSGPRVPRMSLDVPRASLQPCIRAFWPLVLATLACAAPVMAAGDSVNASATNIWQNLVTFDVSAVGLVVAWNSLEEQKRENAIQKRVNEEQRLKTVEGQAELVARFIQASRVPPPQLQYGEASLIERQQVVDAVRFARNRTGIELLHGPRGSGKSTALRLALHHEPAGVAVEISDGKLGSMPAAMVRSMGGRVPVGSDAETVMVEALKRINKPTFVISIDEKCTPQRLLDTLLICKVWSEDLGLAKIFIALELSRAALGVGVGLDKLRVKSLEVGELLEEEAELYLQQVLGDVCMELGSWRADGTKCTLAQYATEQLGTLPLTVKQLCDDCHGLSLEANDLRDHIEQVAGRRNKGSLSSLKLFLRSVAKAGGVNPRQGIKVIKGVMMKGQVALDDLCDTLGITCEVLVELNARTRVPPLLINPDDEMVKLASIHVNRAGATLVDEQRQFAWLRRWLQENNAPTSL